MTRNPPSGEPAILRDWPRIVGAMLSRIAKPCAFSPREGTLTVRVNTVSWLLELVIAESEILGRLNAPDDKGRHARRVHRIVWQLSEAR